MGMRLVFLNSKMKMCCNDGSNKKAVLASTKFGVIKVLRSLYLGSNTRRTWSNDKQQPVRDVLKI